jgi:hypothetical protein
MLARTTQVTVKLPEDAVPHNTGVREVVWRARDRAIAVNVLGEMDGMFMYRCPQDYLVSGYQRFAGAYCLRPQGRSTIIYLVA